MKRSEMLDLIEKAGMLAPYRFKTEDEKTAYDAIDQYNYCHIWESEDSE